MVVPPGASWARANTGTSSEMLGGCALFSCWKPKHSKSYDCISSPQHKGSPLFIGNTQPSYYRTERVCKCKNRHLDAICIGRRREHWGWSIRQASVNTFSQEKVCTPQENGLSALSSFFLKSWLIRVWCSAGENSVFRSRPQMSPIGISWKNPFFFKSIHQGRGSQPS